ncbi:aminoglycoside adenylyltransferase [Streptomyces sp. SID3343]|uniref:nucleotidyltransferase domain-containing protein n=1 Tax=Streptomyces sp. SID3343 TaxID=2690260 RepID=UPI0031F838CD
MDDYSDSVRAQLQVIAEFVASARESNVEVQLRGGWAMDFFLHRVTREHGDVDWFAWAVDVPALTDVLAARGWVRLAKAPPEQQLDYLAGDVEVGIALLARDPEGRPVVAGGPWAGAVWPAGLLDGPLGRLGEVSCPIVSAAAQIEIKLMTPTWMPGRPRRAKDVEDVARLREGLAGARDGLA